jgi:hypothetical protein
MLEEPLPQPLSYEERGVTSPFPYREGGWGVRFLITESML